MSYVHDRHLGIQDQRGNQNQFLSSGLDSSQKRAYYAASIDVLRGGVDFVKESVCPFGDILCTQAVQQLLLGVTTKGYLVVWNQQDGAVLDFVDLLALTSPTAADTVSSSGNSAVSYRVSAQAAPITTRDKHLPEGDSSRRLVPALRQPGESTEVALESIDADDAFEDPFWSESRVLALQGQRRLKRMRITAKKANGAFAVGEAVDDDFTKPEYAERTDDYYIFDDAFLGPDDDDDGTEDVVETGGDTDEYDEHDQGLGSSKMASDHIPPGQEYLRKRPKKKERYMSRAEFILQRQRKRVAAEEQDKQVAIYSKRLVAAVFCKRHQQHIPLLIITAAGVGRLVLARLDLAKAQTAVRTDAKLDGVNQPLAETSSSASNSDASQDSALDVFRSLTSLAQHSHYTKEIEEQHAAAAEAAARAAAAIVNSPIIAQPSPDSTNLYSSHTSSALSLAQLAARSMTGIVIQCTVTAEATLCRRNAPGAPNPILTYVAAARWFVLAHGGDVAAFADESLERIWNCDVYSAVSQGQVPSPPGLGSVSNMSSGSTSEHQSGFSPVAGGRGANGSLYDHRITAFCALHDALMFVVGTASGCIVRLDIRRRAQQSVAGMGQTPSGSSTTKMLTVTASLVLRLTHTILRQNLSLVDIVSLGGAHRSVLCDDLQYDPALIGTVIAATNGTPATPGVSSSRKSTNHPALGWSWEGDGEGPIGIDDGDTAQPEKLGLYGRVVIPDTTGGDERLPLLLHRGVAAFRGFIGGLGASFTQGVGISAASLQTQIRAHLRSANNYGAYAGTGYAYHHARSKSRAVAAMASGDILTDPGNLHMSEGAASSSVSDFLNLTTSLASPTSASNRENTKSYTNTLTVPGQDSKGTLSNQSNSTPRNEPASHSLGTITCATPSCNNPLIWILPSPSELRTISSYLSSGNLLVSPNVAISDPSLSPLSYAKTPKESSVFSFPMSPMSASNSIGMNRYVDPSRLVSSGQVGSPFTLAMVAATSQADPAICELDAEANAWASRGPANITCLALFEPSSTSPLVRKFGLTSLSHGNGFDTPSGVNLGNNRNMRAEPVLAIGLADGTIRLYAGATFRELMFILDPQVVGLVRIMRPIVSVVPADGGRLLYSLDAAGVLRTWDLEKQALVGMNTINEPQKVLELRLLPKDQSNDPPTSTRSKGMITNDTRSTIIDSTLRVDLNPKRDELMLLNLGSWIHLAPKVDEDSQVDRTASALPSAPSAISADILRTPRSDRNPLQNGSIVVPASTTHAAPRRSHMKTFSFAQTELSQKFGHKM